MAPVSQEKQTLLVLPALSVPLSRRSLRTAYKSTFESLLPKLAASTTPPHVSRLDVAIALSPSYLISPPASRTAIFPEILKLLEEMYTLICLVAANIKIELDYPGGIDVRIFVLEPRTDQLPDQILRKQPFSGPLVDLHTFVAAQSASKYDFYTVESEAGLQSWDKLAQAWLSKHHNSPSVQRLPCGPAISTSITDASLHSQFQPPASSSDQIHKSIAVGGTFDHLHIGHKLLLTAIILLASPFPEPSTARKITVGITGDALLVKKKHASVLESWSTRQSRTAAFIESILVFHPAHDPASIRETQVISDPGPNGHVVRVTYGKETDSEIVINYTTIEDPFGPTITDEEISALVISKETRAGGKAVNEKRREKGWKELEVFEVDVLDTSPEEEGGEVEKEDFESKISSTEIRRRLEASATEVTGN